MQRRYTGETAADAGLSTSLSEWAEMAAFKGCHVRRCRLIPHPLALFGRKVATEVVFINRRGEIISCL
jgi:hypothetical protein